MMTNTLARSALALIAFACLQGTLLAQEETPPGEVPAVVDEAVPAATDASAPVEVVEPAATIPVEEAAPTVTEPVAKSKDATQLDTISVTGSRIKRTDYETAQPVVTITREDIERTGLTDISQLLRQLPAAGNASVNAQAQARTTSLGETSLDLRNLGGPRTLLLVNGRRWVTGLVSTQPSVADLNTIPTAIIERIEVLKDGASAIYGSDAIGGVVNVITSKSYIGWGLSSQIGQFASEGDGAKQQHSLSWGMTEQKTSVFANFSYTEEQEALARNRPYTASPYSETGFSRWGNAIPSGRFLFIPTQNNAGLYQCENLQGGIAAGAAGGGQFGGAVGPVATQSGSIPAGVVLCDLTLINGAEGGAPGDYRLRDADNINDRYNHFNEAVLQQPSERIALFSTVSHQLTDSIGLSLEGLYNSRKSTGVYGALTLFGGNLIGVDAPFPVSNTNNPFQQDIGIDSSCGGDPNSTSCTGLGPGSGAWIMRLPSEGRAIWHFDNKADTWRLAAALNGDADALGQLLSWETGAVTARATNEELTPLIRFDKLKLATSTADCGADCVPFTPFMGQAGVTQAMLDYLYEDTVQNNTSTQNILYATTSTTFDLPEGWLAGPLAVAGGLEYRRDEFTSVPDPSVQAGLTFLNQQAPTSGATNAKEAFVELAVPLLADLPGVRSLDLSLAGRYSKYPRIDGVTTYKAGMRWNPLDDLLVRATYSTGFRAPNIGELFLGAAQSFDPMDDPCVTPSPQAATNCDADQVNPDLAENTATSYYSLWSGNPNLKPETSKNMTYGLVYSPDFVPDLNLYLDAYKITVDDYISIGGPLAQFYLDSCYEVPADQRTYCDQINRRGGQALDFVETPYVNFSSVSTGGVDGGFDYLLPVPESLGRLKFALDASYLATYDITRPRPGQPDDVSHWVGKSDLLTGWPRWKAGTQVAWTKDQFTVTWLTRMAYKMTEPCDDGRLPSFSSLELCTFNSPAVADDLSTTEIDESKADESVNVWKTVFYHNMQVDYALPRYDAHIVVGVNNVLDQDPVRSYGIAGTYWYNYDPQHYDTPGRFGYVRVGFKF